MKKLILPIVLLLMVITSYASILISQKIFNSNPKGGTATTLSDKPFIERVSTDLIKFESEEEFSEYLKSAPETQGGFGMMRAIPTMAIEESDMVGLGAVPMAVDMGMKNTAAPDRTSQTNVQVEGIDEPDIVKVGGKNIYTSFQTYFSRGIPTPEPILFDAEVGEMYPKPTIIKEPEYGTNIIKAFPPEEIQKLGGIEEIGQMLYVNDTLIIFTYDTIYAYDVSNPELPVESWTIPYGEDTNYNAARLYGDKLYLVTETYIHRGGPCPITPITVDGEKISIPCTDIYHPRTPVQTESTFTVFKIDTKNGGIEDKLSFVGAARDSVIYMSTKNIYVTYTYAEDYVNIFLGFLLNEETGFFPEDIVEKVKKLASYDISQTSKMMELQMILEDFIYSLPEDEELELQNNFEDMMDTYMEKHVRDFSTTGIVKIDKDRLDIDKTGKVPGAPLNQFSLDEYESNLRIATTSGQLDSWNTLGKINDVYVLDKNMDVVGQVLDLGKDEKIYSARFIGDKGYVVTFRQTDPFYVLDLSNPKDPKMTGELKIPGYSSYLHPLEKDTILGIGRDGSKVKLSLFDVSDAKNPIEIDKYMLDEYYSEAVDNHHAFLQDARHNVFFLPGSKGGYIFTYSNNKLSMEKAVATTDVKRAVYMDDYMYIIGGQEIVVLDETTWDRVGEFEF